ncbi:MAG: hypothetical protein BWZ01_01600 [Deltaproteobacteria bacterium ADurb.BinA179]|nr:MAG: hypothetical protein BWZ01_01600 [Deltaproteobacteria bacterium ADurb.BinA179]HNS91086.1 hypothetical protein [Deltaproteobacteria bacterium]
MAEKRNVLNVVLVLAGLTLAGFLILRVASSSGIFPFMYTEARSPRDLLEFLESRTAHVKGIRVNGHLLEIGKRPSLQVLKGYDRLMYQVRPYRQVNYKYRNFTGAEVMDFCTTITGESFDSLRSSMDSEKGYTPAWKGRIRGNDITLVRVSRFSYLVTGLAEKPLFMGQVELAKRLGMNDATVLQLVIPVQDRWLEGFKAAPAIEMTYPVQFSGKDRDELIAWLDGASE